jgi:hypothetical protein
MLRATALLIISQLFEIFATDLAGLPLSNLIAEDIFIEKVYRVREEIFDVFCLGPLSAAGCHPTDRPSGEILQSPIVGQLI